MCDTQTHTHRRNLAELCAARSFGISSLQLPGAQMCTVGFPCTHTHTHTAARLAQPCRHTPHRRPPSCLPPAPGRPLLSASPCPSPAAKRLRQPQPGARTGAREEERLGWGKEAEEPRGLGPSPPVGTRLLHPMRSQA